MINKAKELRVKTLRTVTIYFFPLSFIEVQLIYNVVLISAVQQSDSVICIYILFHILFHYGLLQYIQWFPILSSRTLLVFFPFFFLILGKLWKFSTRISLYCSFPYLANGRKSSYVTRPRWALSNKVFVCFKLNYHRTQMSFVPFKANTSEGWLYTTPTVLDCHCSKLFFENCPQNPLYNFFMSLLAANLCFLWTLFLISKGDSDSTW